MESAAIVGTIALGDGQLKQLANSCLEVNWTAYLACCGTRVQMQSKKLQRSPWESHKFTILLETCCQNLFYTKMLFPAIASLFLWCSESLSPFLVSCACSPPPTLTSAQGSQRKDKTNKNTSERHSPQAQKPNALSCGATPGKQEVIVIELPSSTTRDTSCS